MAKEKTEEVIEKVEEAKEETGIAKKEQAPLQSTGDDIFDLIEDGDADGFEEITAEDIKIPSIKIVQSNSAEAQGKDAVAKAGQFYNAQTKEAFDKLENVHLIKLSRMRSMFPEVYQKGDKLQCMSELGGKVKSARITSNKYSDPAGGQCANCEHQIWPEDSASGPRCKLGWVLIGTYKPEGSDQPRMFRMLLNGSSYKPTSNLVSQVIARRSVSKEGEKKRKSAPLYAFKMDIGTEYTEGAKGNYYVAEFDLKDGFATREDFIELRDLSDAYKEIFAQVIEREVSNQSEAPAESIEVDYEVMGEDGDGELV